MSGLAVGKSKTDIIWKKWKATEGIDNANKTTGVSVTWRQYSSARNHKKISTIGISDLVRTATYAILWFTIKRIGLCQEI